jgi:acetolactate synthase-1/2/3 large subunit
LISGAQSLVRALQSRGVRHTFGIPGAQNLEIFDALADGGPRNILPASELGAAFMADGYARASGGIGVCLAIPGPGLTNMITGLAEAFLDSSPLVVLVTAVERSDQAFHLHEIDQVQAVKPVVKQVITVGEAREIAVRVGEAFDLAEQGEPGPVLVELPRELLRERVDPGPLASAAGGTREPIDGQAIDRIAQMLKGARFCGIYAGKGALGASAELVRLAELLQAPVATTISGKGAIPEDHPLAVGFGFGPSGTRAAREFFGRCDVVLAVGCKFAEMSTSKWLMSMNGKLIHVDRSPRVLNRNYPADIALCAEAKTALGAILSRLGDTGAPEADELKQEIEKARQKEIKRVNGIESKEGVHPSRLLYRLREQTDRDTVVVTDCGSHQLWAVLDWQVLAPHTFVTPSDYQAMGFGVPAAVGACLANPDRRVVCLSGDGGLLITGFELLTAVRERLKLTVILFNDGALGLIKDMQEKFYGRSESVQLCSPDYRQLAAALGAGYLAISCDEELDAGLQQVRQSDGVLLVDVKVDYSQWPDFIDRAVKARFLGLPLGEKVRMLAERALRVLKQGR